MAERHGKITRRNGKAAANGPCASCAIYNHARRTSRELPLDNSSSGVGWNLEMRRNTAMGVEEVPAWFREAGACVTLQEA